MPTEPAPFREPTELLSRMGTLRSPLPSNGALYSTLVASCSAAPPWHPCCPLSRGPLHCHGPDPPQSLPYSPPLCRSPGLEVSGTSGSCTYKGGGVMSGVQAGVPSLTTRGRHLPSSWTNFPSLNIPVTEHILSCSPLSLSYIRPHAPPCLVRLSMHMFVCVCICLTVFLLPSTFGFCARDTSTVLPFGGVPF